MAQEVASRLQPEGNGDRRILVVDDEIRYLESVTAVVSAHGYAVRAARSAAEAVATLQQWRPQLVILDIHLAASSGFEVLERMQAVISNAAPSQSAPRFIVISADTRFDSAVRALRAGVTDYLAKPLRPQRLIEVLDREFAARDEIVTPAAAAPAGDIGAALAESILEDAPFLVYVLDAAGNITFLNRHAESVFGVERIEFLNQPWTAMFHGEQQLEAARHRFNERRRGTRATSNMPLTLLVPGRSDDVSTLPRRIDLKLFSTGIYRQVNGHEAFAGTCGFAAIESMHELPANAVTLRSTARSAPGDVTLSMPAPQVRAPELPSALIDALPLPIPVLHVDRADLTLRHANPAALQRPARIRLTPERLLDWLEVPEAEWYAFLDLARDRAVTGRLLGDAGGFPRWQASSFPAPGENAIVVLLHDLGAMATAHDQMIRLERSFQQSARLDAIRHIGGGLAHDFNNILASILGFTELAIAQRDAERSAAPASNDDPDDRTGVFLREAITAGHRARDLVQRIVELCSNDLDSATTPEPAEVIHRLLDRTRRILPASVNLQTHVDPAIGTLPVAPDTLARILVHLLGNARDAIDGRGTIELGTELVGPECGHCAACRREIRGQFLKITVKDSGAGLPPGSARDLFHLMARSGGIESSTRTGLAIVARDLHDHGGHLQLHSMEGLGTVVSVYLPCESEPGFGGRATEQIDVLVVEQDLSVGWLISEYLEQLGYATQLQIDPYQALMTLEASDDSIRVVICNSVLELDAGRRLLERIVERNGGAAIVALVHDHDGPLPAGVHALPSRTDRSSLARLLNEIAPLPEH